MNKITSALDDFPFWPSNKDAHLAGPRFVLWSENHILMSKFSAFVSAVEEKMMDSEKVYTATNVVTGGVIREDHNVMNVSVSVLLFMP